MKTKIVTGRDYEGKMYFAIRRTDGEVLRAGYPTRRQAERAQKELERT